MSKIIRPFGKLAARMEIKWDMNGNTVIDAHYIDQLSGAKIPMLPLNIAGQLSAIVAQSISGIVMEMQQAKRKPSEIEVEASNGDQTA